jgi:Transposase DDE domain
MTFGFLKRKRAPLEDLAQPLGVSRQALHKRLDKPKTADFCRRALLHAVQHIVDARAVVRPLLERFAGVYLDDCTSAPLPATAAADFPGTGGTPDAPPDARMKFLVRWEIQTGNVCHVGIHAGRTSDHDALALAPTLPPRSLHLADLGFADFDRLQTEMDQGVYVITRLPAQTRLYPEGGGDLPLAKQLATWRQDGRKVVDVAAAVGNKTRVTGRLVALACPAAVAARRLAALEKDAKHRGRTVSGRQREMCHWTVLLTNLPADPFDAESLWALYRLRWQIELLFKRFKSEGGLGQTSSTKRYRVETEWYARLLGQVVRNWLQLLHGGPLRDVNPVQVGRVIADHIARLAAALATGDVAAVAAILADLKRELDKIRNRTKRQKGQTAAQNFEKRKPDAFG